MYAAVLMMCLIGTNVPSAEVCMPVYSPILYNTEQDCQSALIKFIMLSEQFQTFTENLEVHDLQCFRFKSKGEEET